MNICKKILFLSLSMIAIGASMNAQNIKQPKKEVKTQLSLRQKAQIKVKNAWNAVKTDCLENPFKYVITGLAVTGAVGFALYMHNSNAILQEGIKKANQVIEAQ